MKNEVWVVENTNGVCLTLGEDNVLWIGNLRDRPTAFNTKVAAEAAINRTNRYAKKNNYPWDQAHKVVRFSRG